MPLRGRGKYTPGWLRGLWVAEGDSVTLGTNANGLTKEQTYVAKAYVLLVAAGATIDGLFNLGLDAKQATTMQSEGAALADSQWRAGTIRMVAGGNGNLSTCYGGVNDLYNGALRTPTQNALKGYGTDRVTKGFVHVPCTIMATAGAGKAGTYDVEVAAVNADMKANWALYGARSADAVARFDEIAFNPVTQSIGDFNHPISSIHSLMAAELFRAQMVALGP
jgi:hypothetical protein